MKETTQAAAPRKVEARYVIVLALIVFAFFASYRVALARTGRTAPALGQALASAGGGGCCGGGGGAAQGAAAPGSANQGLLGGGGGGGCCGGGGSGKKIEGTAQLQGGVQRIAVDVSAGYNPNVIKLKAGVPTEITFGQGSGCLGQVQSQQLGFFEDLTGGPKTVKIPALAAGTYGFTCGMGMVNGSIVVE